MKALLLRVLAWLAHLIAAAQKALGEAETAVSVEILRSGVAIADNVDALVGEVHTLDRNLAEKLVAMEVAKRV